MKTALQQAIREIAELWSSPSDQPNYTQVLKILESKLEIEKQQIIDCSIETSQDCFTSVMAYMGQEIVFNEEDLINQRKEAEQYYNETFKQQE
jgi:hypothetical protein